MKKKVALMLAMALACNVTACGGTGNTETTKDDTEGKAAVDILTDVWAAFDADEKFAVSGGDYENMVEEAPGTINVSDGAVLDQLFGFPADSADLLDDGASLIHMMNQNTFTAAVYHLTDAENVDNTASAVKENIMNRHWMCGFPEDLVIYSVGDSYLVAAFGTENNVDAFEMHLQETYKSAKLLFEEDIE